jgi:hypothetical protein
LSNVLSLVVGEKIWSLSQQFGLYDKKHYYFYQCQDGSRWWYRTGQPAFRSDVRAKAAKKKAAMKKNKGKSSGGGSNKGSSSGGSTRKPQWDGSHELIVLKA